MKIAIVVPIIGNFGRRGFYHSQEIGLGKEISKSGHQVVIYKCVPKNSMDSISIEEKDGIKVKYIPTKSIGVHGLFKPSLIEEDTNIVFAFSDTQLIIPIIYRYCKKNNINFVPYVGIAHSFQKNIKSKIMDLIFKLTTLNVYKKEKVLVKTNAVKKELINMGVNNCIVTPVGLDFKSLKEDFERYNRDELRKKWGFSSNDTIISFIARLQPEKRPLELIDILKKINLKNKKMLIVGDGPLKRELEKKIEENNLRDKVVIISQVKYDEIWQIHYISDYFLNLRDNEIFGMAIMEAVYYKSCVVAISAPGPDTILEGMNGHHICKTFNEIYDVINNTKIDHQSLLNEQKKLVEKFTWNMCASAILRELI